MASLYVLLAIVAAASAYCIQEFSNLDQKQIDEWNMYKQDYRKQYKNIAEEEFRMKIYFTNKYIIDEHNRRYESGLESFSRKSNQFSDMTHREYRDYARGFKHINDKLTKGTTTNTNI